jgi:hypothetical protein
MGFLGIANRKSANKIYTQNNRGIFLVCERQKKLERIPFIPKNSPLIPKSASLIPFSFNVPLFVIILHSIIEIAKKYSIKNSTKSLFRLQKTHDFWSWAF